MMLNEEAYQAAARRKYQREGEIEIDADSAVSESEDGALRSGVGMGRQRGPQVTRLLPIIVLLALVPWPVPLSCPDCDTWPIMQAPQAEVCYKALGLDCGPRTPFGPPSAQERRERQEQLLGQLRTWKVVPTWF